MSVAPEVAWAALKDFFNERGVVGPQDLRPSTTLASLGYADITDRIEIVDGVLGRLRPDPAAKVRRLSVAKLARRVERVRTAEDAVKLIVRLVREAEPTPREELTGAAARPDKVYYHVLGMGTAATPKPVRLKNAMVAKIHFATDRAPVANKRIGRSYGSARTRQLSLGECEVSVPLERLVGSLPRPHWWEREAVEKHFVLKSLTELTEASFYSRIAERMSSSPRREAFIFVHGFNITFEEAALRTAQLAIDLKFEGPPILYSWPSRGELLDYISDGNSINYSSRNFTNFLSEVGARTGATHVHVIAHSMGNRAVCDALERLGRQPDGGAAARLSHVILTAPDVDADTFRDAAAAICSTSNSVTLYASSRDRALQIARRLNRAPRAGEPIVIVAGVESVDASTVKTDFLSHGYFSEAREMLEDMFDLLRGTPAGQRFNLVPRTHLDGNYFAFRP